MALVNASELTGLMDDSGFIVFQQVNAYAGMTVSLLGVVFNILNIKTFTSMGVDDGVTVSFLGLALSDLFLSVIVFFTSIALAIHCVEMNVGHLYRIDPWMPCWYLGNIGIAMYNTTILTTVYLAVARCMCVVRPLNFKHVFTSSRSVVLITAFALFSAIVYTPVFAHMGVQEVYSDKLNATRLVMWLSPQREQVKDVVYLIILMIIPVSSQVIVIACIIIMSWSLRQAIRFRNSATSLGNGENTDGTAKDARDDSSRTKLSGKELQAVQQVILISAIFILCNTPMILISLCGALIPGYDASREEHKYFRLYTASHKGRRVIEQLNSSVNIFVYYKYNARFRKHFKFC